MKETHIYTLHELGEPYTSKNLVLSVAKLTPPYKTGSSSASLGIFYENRVFIFLLEKPYQANVGYRMPIWANLGGRYLGEVELDASPFSPVLNKKAYEEVKVILDKFIADLGRCACCGKEMPLSPAVKAGRTIYAGTYCEVCWSLPKIKQEKHEEGL